AIPLRDLRLRTRTAQSRRGLQGDVREGAERRALWRYHHRSYRCAGVLLRRGLSPAISCQEPGGLLRARRHRRRLPDRHWRRGVNSRPGNQSRGAHAPLACFRGPSRELAAHSFARSTYEPSAVITTTRVPAVMNGGTLVRTPFDNVAGL